MFYYYAINNYSPTELHKHTHTQSSRVFLFIFIIICMFCVFLYLCKCNLECTIFIIINLLNNVIAMHSRGPHRAHSYHTQHPIQHACKAFAFDFAMKQTVTLRFNRFVKVTNETASMAFGTRSFVSLPNKVLQRVLFFYFHVCCPPR